MSITQLRSSGGTLAVVPLTRDELARRTDEQLVERFRDGEEAAFDVICERYRGILIRYSAPLVGADRAQDVVQHTLAQAYQRMHNERAIVLRYWLLRVARNFSIDLLRQKDARHEQLSDEHHRHSIPRQMSGDEIAIEQVFDGIRELPPRQRQALLLREMEGRSYNEIAQQLGETTPIVAQLIRRARLRLRQAV